MPGWANSAQSPLPDAASNPVATSADRKPRPAHRPSPVPPGTGAVCYRGRTPRRRQPRPQWRPHPMPARSCVAPTQAWWQTPPPQESRPPGGVLDPQPTPAECKVPGPPAPSLDRWLAEKHANLAVLDAPSRAAILTLYTRRMLTLLQKTRLIDDEYRLPTVQFFHYITAYPVARLFCIPARSVQKMLDRIRRRFAHPLGQLPAVLALTAAQQALQIRKAPRTGFRTRKQLRDQPMRPQQLALPSRQTFLHHPCRRITPQ